MKNTCIPHPPREPLVQIRPWQVEACRGNLCAAALLNFFEYWHNVKLDGQGQARTMNDVSEKHGDPRSQEESLLQWHSTEDLQRGLLGLYGESVVQRSVKELATLGFLSIQKNPNPAYKWDKTNFYLFQVDAVISWLREHRGLDTDYSPQTPVKSDAVKIRHRERENTASTAQKYGVDSLKNTAAITEITTKKKEPTTSPASPKSDAESEVVESPAEKFVNWWNRDIVPLGGRPFSLDDADDKFIAKANKALRDKSSKSFWTRVTEGFRASAFLRGEVKPTEGHRRFKATLPWLLSLHYTKKIVNYALVASGEWTDEAEPGDTPTYFADGSRKGEI
jgi:hypothetical protein